MIMTSQVHEAPMRSLATLIVCSVHSSKTFAETGGDKKREGETRRLGRARGGSRAEGGESVLFRSVAASGCGIRERNES